MWLRCVDLLDGHAWTWTSTPGTHPQLRDGALWAVPQEDGVSLGVAASVQAPPPQWDGRQGLAAPL